MWTLNLIQIVPLLNTQTFKKTLGHGVTGKAQKLNDNRGYILA
jgi:hypothetical protein